MSANPNQICRNTYFNYGSYLRSRGYDKFICNLVTDIEQGLIPIGPITPTGKCGATMNGTFTIVPCTGVDNDVFDPNLGRLVVSGGWNGVEGGDPAEKLLGHFTSGADHFSIQAANGIQVLGPIVSNNSGTNYIYTDPLYDTTNLVNTNLLMADKTYFYGTDITGSDPGASTHDVRISGDLAVFNNVDVSGTLQVDEDATFWSNIYCDGSANIALDISCGRNVYVHNDLSVNNLTYTTNLEVSHDASMGQWISDPNTHSFVVERPHVLDHDIARIYMNNLPEGVHLSLSVDDDGRVYKRPAAEALAAPSSVSYAKTQEFPENISKRMLVLEKKIIEFRKRIDVLEKALNKK